MLMYFITLLLCLIRLVNQQKPHHLLQKFQEPPSGAKGRNSLRVRPNMYQHKLLNLPESNTPVAFVEMLCHLKATLNSLKSTSVQMHQGRVPRRSGFPRCDRRKQQRRPNKQHSKFPNKK